MKKLLQKISVASVMFMSSVSVALADSAIGNPLKYDTVEKLLNGIAGFLFYISIPIVTIMILWGAWLMLTSAGSPDKVEQGKKTILYAVLGFIVVLVASSIPSLLESLLGVKEVVQ